MLNRICRAAFWLYVVLAILALSLVPISEWGLFGVEPSPLAGVFAVMLAQPWLSMLPDVAADRGVWRGLALVGVCLAFNATILRLLCRLLRL